jgi:hypothetical protein
VPWATGGQSGSWHTDFGSHFYGKIWEAWQSLSQETASEVNVTQTNDGIPLHVHTIDPTKNIKLCHGQLEANLAHGTQILVPISVAKFGKHGKV